MNSQFFYDKIISMKTIILGNQNKTSDVVKQASDIIRGGGVIILPFDTVYGFACDPKKATALQKIYELKNRPTQKTIGLAVSKIKTLESIAETSTSINKYVSDRTPGKFTFILKKKTGTFISEFCVLNNNIGIRIPDSKLILEIIAVSGGIIAQTSANISGQPNCFSVNDIRRQFSSTNLDKIDLIVDGGKLKHDKPSKITDLTGEVPREIKRS